MQTTSNKNANKKIPSERMKPKKISLFWKKMLQLQSNTSICLLGKLPMTSIVLKETKFYSVYSRG